MSVCQFYLAKQIFKKIYGKCENTASYYQIHSLTEFQTINFKYMRNIKLIKELQIVLLNAAFVLVAIMFVAMGIKSQRSVSGKVTDESKNPLPGVSIVIKGTNSGTLTDVGGKYNIMVPEGKCKLLFTYVGYATQEIDVSGKNVLDVVLKEEVSQLNEVVVLGYGAEKRSKVTGSISSIKACDMALAPPSQSYNPTYYNPSVESYSKINENGFKSVKLDPLSTFSIDVDRASYSNVRRFINQGQLPPADAVKIEEMVNYFEYDYPQPTDEHPFSINTELSECPWQKDHRILHIGLQGKKISTDNLPPSNMVFLLDVSGSMGEPNKLPLVIAAFKLLVNNLREKDMIAIVVYAGAAGLVLPSTKGSQKDKIIDALNSLQAGGSTAGCEGIALAYKIAQENFVKGGNNRVILATDGDFNVGLSNENELEDFIVEKRKSGIFLTCLGFGMGNYKDSKIEILADKGNGNYDYIDDLMEANKVFVNEFGGTLFTIAKDVKIQIEFNPAKVQSYRLLGYENRLLNNEDFKDDTKDAGELGSGHTVTAVYEIIPAGVNSKYVPDADPLKYQNRDNHDNSSSDEIATVKFRYKKPDGDKSIEMVHPIADYCKSFDKASDNIRFSSAVAMFGMILRDSEFKGSSSISKVVELADNARGKDKEGYRGEFVRLVKLANGFKMSANNENE
jgi:Ca-activated chloride channel homolog